MSDLYAPFKRYTNLVVAQTQREHRANHVDTGVVGKALHWTCQSQLIFGGKIPSKARGTVVQRAVSFLTIMQSTKPLAMRDDHGGSVGFTHLQEDLRVLVVLFQMHTLITNDFKEPSNIPRVLL